MTRRRLRVSLVLCFSLVATLFALRPAGAVGTFANAQNYPAFQQPAGLVSGDFNGDTFEDLVTALPSGLAFFPGNGNGYFGAQSFNYMMSGTATDIAAGQFVPGGGLDLAVSTTNGLQVFNGSGLGTFSQSSVLALGVNFNSVAAGDVTGEGRIDAVASSAIASTVTTFPNNGMSLMTGMTFPTGASPQSVLLTNVDAGTTLDIVTANVSSVSALLGTGMGNYGIAMNTPLSVPAYGIDAGLITGDASMDLVVAGYQMMGNSGVTVLIGNQTGNFFPLTTSAAGSQPRDVKLADINLDAQLDAVVANYGSNSVSVMLGNGSGALAGPTNYSVGTNPAAILARDLDGSGTVDVATANLTSKDISVLLNASTPSAPLNLTAAPGPGQGQITLTWQPPADDGGSAVQYYNIYRGASPGAEVLIYLGAPAGSWTDFGLANGTTYYYMVTAVNVAGEGAFSNEANARTFGPPTEPQSVTAAPGSAVGAITLSWQAPASDGGQPITGWIVCRGTSQGLHPFCGTLPASSTSYTDGGLLPLTSYYYVVRAENALGQSGASNEACTKPFPWASALGC